MFKVASAVLLAAALVVPAHAATTVTLSPAGDVGTAGIIQSFTTPNPGGSEFVPNTTNTSPGENSPSGFETVSGPFGSLTTRNTLRDGMTGNPDSDYLRITNGGSYSISFAATPVALFSFAFNNLATASNQLTLVYSDSTSQVFNLANNFGLTEAVPAFGRLSYDVGGGSRIASAQFSRIVPGVSNPLHIDDIAVAVPEPAAWLMMILGFGVVGSQLRRRKSKLKLTFAAA